MPARHRAAEPLGDLRPRSGAHLLELEEAGVAGVEGGLEEPADREVAVAGRRTAARRGVTRRAEDRIGELHGGDAGTRSADAFLVVALHPTVAQVSNDIDAGSFGHVGAVAQRVHKRHVRAQRWLDGETHPPRPARRRHRERPPRRVIR